MTIALLPATFDPITRGHVDIAARAAKLFDHLFVAVASHPGKNVLFSIDERRAMVEESLEGLPIEVLSFDGLVVDVCRQVGAGVVVRGMRALSDFEWEYQQASLNRQMLQGLEVIQLFASVEYAFLSSSIVKDIAEHGGDVSSMVPPPVLRRLNALFSGHQASTSMRR